MIEEKTLHTLEFDEVLRRVSAFAVSEIAKDETLQVTPAQTIEEIEQLLQLTAEAYIVRYRYNYDPILAIDDCKSSIAKASVGASLQIVELLKVARLLRAARIAKSTVMQCGDDVSALRSVVAFLQPDHTLENDIGHCIASESELRDDASPALKTIRRKITTTNIRIKNKLNDYLRNSAKYLQDNLITVREGRFVLPLKAESRSAIPGLIHDTSGSGATVYVEPFPIVEMNNELRTLQAEEREEIERILQALSARVGEQADSLILCQNQCVMLDIIFAKAAYSVSMSGIRPTLNKNGYLFLPDARHPLIAKDKVVPVSIAVGQDCRILVITGPNTGGKTVCLKTAGLMCLMSYSGIFVPCAETAEIAVYDGVYCDIGDEQSIEQSLSTFSSHVVNLVAITDAVTPNSLVLLDELGGGTDPNEGAALARGVLQYLEAVRAKGIVTTHYGALKAYSLLSENLKNASMQFDEQTLRPTYKLISGVPGVSNALKIARSLGLNDFILQKAQESLQKETVQFEEVLARAEKLQAQAEEAYADSKRLKQKWEDSCREIAAERQALQARLDRINSNAKAETLRLVGSARDEADEIIEQMKQLVKSADEAALLQARKLRNRLDGMYFKEETMSAAPFRPIPLIDLQPNTPVFVRSLQAEGIVQSVNKKKEAVVRVGAVNVTVKTDDLGYTAISKKPPRVLPKTSPRSTGNDEKGITEVKVLGLTVSEAIAVIDPYILDVSQSKGILKIVHGKGTGALGKGIQQYLRSNSLVASYRYGGYGEGETGVTIVEFK